MHIKFYSAVAMSAILSSQSGSSAGGLASALNLSKNSHPADTNNLDEPTSLGKNDLAQQGNDSKPASESESNPEPANQSAKSGFLARALANRGHADNSSFEASIIRKYKQEEATQDTQNLSRYAMMSHIAIGAFLLYKHFFPGTPGMED